MKRFYFALLPWVAFDIAMRSHGLDAAWGAVFALGIGVLGFALGIRSRTVGSMDVFALVLFVALFVSGLVGRSGSPFGASTRGFATAALGAFCLGSCLASPVVRSSLLEVVPPRQQRRPELGRVSVMLSALWGTAFLLIALLDQLSVMDSSVLAKTVFAWLLPIALVLSAARWSSGLLARNFDLDGSSSDDLVPLIELGTDSSDVGRRRPAPALELYREVDGSSTG